MRRNVDALGFALVRGEVRLGFLLYRSWGGGGGGGGGGGAGGYERIQKFGEKALKIAHSRTAVPVPVSAVLVQKVYYRFFQGWYRYHYATTTFFLVGTGTSKCGTGTTLLLPVFSLGTSTNF